MVFVGGAVAELYAENSAASDIRPTLDVDCVIELRSSAAHAQLEDDLRAQGFTNDTSPGAPICRWVYQGIKVDVMPTDSTILGFSNKWYPEGIATKIVKDLPDGTAIFVFAPVYYVAAKFEAHKDRGGKDLRQSHDFEDIIYILDNCPGIFNNINQASATVKIYLQAACQQLLANPNLTEGIETALPYGAGEDATEIILTLIQNIANMR